MQGPTPRPCIPTVAVSLSESLRGRARWLAAYLTKSMCQLGTSILRYFGRYINLGRPLSLSGVGRSGPITPEIACSPVVDATGIIQSDVTVLSLPNGLVGQLGNGATVQASKKKKKNFQCLC